MLRATGLSVHSKGSTKLSTHFQVTEHQTDHLAAVTVSDSVLRVLAVVTLMGLALDHIVQLVPTFQSQLLLGVGYLFLIIGLVVVSARLILGARSHLHLWAPVAILGIGAMVAYGFTRVISTPLDSQDVGNWACTLGVVALFLEAGLVAISAYAITNRRHLPKLLKALRN
jgi:hypothetical protein